MCDRAIYGPEKEGILFDFFTKFGHHGNVRHGQKKVVRMGESGVVGWMILFPHLKSQDTNTGIYLVGRRRI